MATVTCNVRGPNLVLETNIVILVYVFMTRHALVVLGTTVSKINVFLDFTVSPSVTVQSIPVARVASVIPFDHVQEIRVMKENALMSFHVISLITNVTMIGNVVVMLIAMNMKPALTTHAHGFHARNIKTVEAITNALSVNAPLNHAKV